MESEDAWEAKTTQMAQAPGGNAESANVKQDCRQEVAACSRVRRIVRRCKEWFFYLKCHCFCPVLVVIVAVTVFGLGANCWISHRGKFLPEQCPSEWIGYKNKCYFISEEEKNWTSCQTFCAENESLLAVFENKEEMRSLTKHLKIDDCWIGLRKKGESFYWENGIALKVDLFQIQNHSECAYLDAFTISTSACSLPRRCICAKLP